MRTAEADAETGCHCRRRHSRRWRPSGGSSRPDRLDRRARVHRAESSLLVVVVRWRWCSRLHCGNGPDELGASGWIEAQKTVHCDCVVAAAAAGDDDDNVVAAVVDKRYLSIGFVGRVAVARAASGTASDVVVVVVDCFSSTSIAWAFRLSALCSPPPSSS